MPVRYIQIYNPKLVKEWFKMGHGVFKRLEHLVSIKLG